MAEPFNDDENLKILRRSAMNMLARREHSAAELQQKLHMRFSECDALIPTCINQLQDEGLQCDRRYSACYIRKRAQQLYGPERIRNELQRNHVERHIIDSEMIESAIDWPWSLQLLLDKKCAGENVAEFDQTQQYKLMAYLVRRGFCEYEVRQLLR